MELEQVNELITEALKENLDLMHEAFIAGDEAGMPRYVAVMMTRDFIKEFREALGQSWLSYIMEYGLGGHPAVERIRDYSKTA